MLAYSLWHVHDSDHEDYHIELVYISKPAPAG